MTKEVEKSGGRKWALAKYIVGLGTLIALAGVVGWVFHLDGSQGILGQGLGLIFLVGGGYFTINVTQKKVERGGN